MEVSFLYAIASVLIVSLISFVGVFTLGIASKKLNAILIYLISFSAGALLGDTFIHLLPSAAENGFTFSISIYVLAGIVISLILEKVIHWQHCHRAVSEKGHIHDFARMNIVGDCLHNFIDGLIIAASYFISIPVGIATTIAVIAHEIPQEIGDFGVLVYGGFSKGKALFVNFLTALTSVAGVIAALLLGNLVENIQAVLIPLAAGVFVYIAGSDLIPELHKDSDKITRSIAQASAFILGILLMVLVLLIE